MKDASPQISVVLPVYNAGEYIKEAIESILSQTFSDFEFIILNDGSKDNSAELIRSFNDDRIVFVEHDNMGLPATLNRGIAMTRAPLIARQDQDDISSLNRLEVQLDFMKRNPNVALLGASAEIIDEQGKFTGKYHDHPTDRNILKFALIFNNPFVHSSVMLRKESWKKAGEYYTGRDVFEDHNLWSRIARIAGVENLPDRLLKYREVNSSMSRTTSDYRQRVANQAFQNVKYYCPAKPDEEVRKFANYMTDAETYEDFAKANELAGKMMTDLCINFSRKENLPHSAFEFEAKRQVVNFKRNYYNNIIFSEDKSVLQKVNARFMRKLLYMSNKEYF